VHAPESELLIRLLRAGLEAVDPARCLPPFLPTAAPAGRTLAIGAGKAAAAMALALARHHTRHDLGPPSGAVVTRYGHGLRPGEDCGAIEVLEAGHPVPDAASEAAGRRILEVAAACRPADRCIALLSGGASSLLVQPAPGLTLADKQALTRRLLDSGATIGEINTVRRRLSVIKGGRLARHIAAGEILLFAISDVPGDHLADIGSGPLTPDPASAAEARAILDRYRIPLNGAVARVLEELPSTHTAAAVPVSSQMVACSGTAVEAAARAARSAGWQVRILPEATGPARAVAGEHAGLVRAARSRGERVALLSGGETTVNVASAGGRGGRNGEYLLALALELGALAGVHALAADTDGIDGTGDSAGALLTPDTLARASEARLDAAAALSGHGSHDFFAALGDLVVTGPTRTNVNDLRIILAC